MRVCMCTCVHAPDLPAHASTLSPAAQAHVESVAASAFYAAVRQCVDPDCRRALKALADLFALRCIEADMLFRNDEYVAPSKVRRSTGSLRSAGKVAAGQHMQGLQRGMQGCSTCAVRWLHCIVACRVSLALAHPHTCVALCAATTPQAKAIQRLIVSLCSELRGGALPLVAAFGVPDHILRAPIGLGSHSGVDMYREYLTSVGFDV